MDRLAMLERMVRERPDDPFPRYGRAMELRRIGRAAEAVAAFEELRRSHPDYVPTYLMLGQCLVAAGDRQRAREVFAAGIEAARRAGDAHAEGELREALADL